MACCLIGWVHNPPGFYSPTITLELVDVGGVEVSGSARGLSIDSNKCFGLGIGKTVVKLPTSAESGVYESMSLFNNKISDCPGVGLDLPMVSCLHRQAILRRNFIGLDPFLRYLSHNVDNTWASTTATTAVLTGGAQSVGVLEGNKFAHCARIIDTTSRVSWGSSNIVIWQPNGGSGLDGTAANR